MPSVLPPSFFQTELYQKTIMNSLSSALAAFASLLLVSQKNDASVPSGAPEPGASAARRLNEPGPENSEMAKRAGTWDVVETIWSAPGAEPTATRHVAERKMIGSFLQETIQPLAGSPVADFRRIYYLSFNRVEGRWKYVSIDTRNPVGLMPAASFAAAEAGGIHLIFEPFAVTGPGAEVAGQMLRMDEIMTIEDADHDSADERFIMADGSGKMWTAFRYEYVRRR